MRRAITRIMRFIFRVGGPSYHQTMSDELKLELEKRDGWRE